MTKAVVDKLSTVNKYVLSERKYLVKQQTGTTHKDKPMPLQCSFQIQFAL